MLFAALAAMLGAHGAVTAHPLWRCRNQVEVWCAADGCAATAEGEFTPMDITADPKGGDLSLCAYSGCWEAKAKPLRRRGRALWVADASFSTHPDGEKTAVTLLIVEEDGVGFVRAGGIATPVLCAHVPEAAGESDPPSVAPEGGAP